MCVEEHIVKIAKLILSSYSFKFGDFLIGWKVWAVIGWFSKTKMSSMHSARVSRGRVFCCCVCYGCGCGCDCSYYCDSGLAVSLVGFGATICKRQLI